MKDQNKNNTQLQKRQFISIYWKCCNAFSRVYKNSEGTHYQGNCPKCRSKIQVPIGEGGVSQRTFIAE